jgi:serine/threonine-protein kinase
MRYVAGTDLQALLARDRRLAPERAAAILAQVAAALDAAHAAGLIHRDVKPANVLLGGDHAYLADFGLSRVASTDERMTTTGHWLGTVDYMAPEQFDGRAVDARADVYALGCVLHTTLTGETPFPRGTVPATMLAHLGEPPPQPSAVAPGVPTASGVPTAFDAVIARALAKAPGSRFPSAGDLARAALAAAEGRAVTESERMVARGAAAPNGNGHRFDEAPTEVLAAVGTASTGGGLWARGPHAEPIGGRADGDAPTHRRDGGDDAPTNALRDGGEPHARHDHRPRTERAPGVTLPLGDRPRRRVRRRLAGAGLAIAGAAGAVALVGATGDGTDAASRPGAPVARGEVTALARAFAAAYAREDADALQRLFSRDAERVLPGGRQRGRAAVVRAYRGQFADSDTRSFTLEGLDAEGGGAGRATARYRATYGGEPDVTGTITFGVRRERGRPRIALVAATPDA